MNSTFYTACVAQKGGTHCYTVTNPPPYSPKGWALLSIQSKSCHQSWTKSGQEWTEDPGRQAPASLQTCSLLLRGEAQFANIWKRAYGASLRRPQTEYSYRGQDRDQTKTVGSFPQGWRASTLRELQYSATLLPGRPLDLATLQCSFLISRMVQYPLVTSMSFRSSTSFFSMQRMSTHPPLISPLPCFLSSGPEGVIHAFLGLQWCPVQLVLPALPSPAPGPYPPALRPIW